MWASHLVHKGNCCHKGLQVISPQLPGPYPRWAKVTLFLKGVFNSRPPTSRYSSTGYVLLYLRSLTDNTSLPLTLLAYKLAMLMTFSNADHCSDLAPLDIRYRSFKVNGVNFIIPGQTKTRRTGPPKKLSMSLSLTLPCTASAWESMNNRQEFFVLEKKGQQIFITVRKSHRFKPATIGHWLKRIMTLCGDWYRDFFSPFYKRSNYLKGKGSRCLCPRHLESCRLELSIHNQEILYISDQSTPQSLVEQFWGAYSPSHPRSWWATNDIM